MIAFLLAPIKAPRTNFRAGTIRAKHDPEVIGIQTRVNDNLCRQGATSDVVCTRKPAAICCDYMSLAHGCCTRPIGHPGTHVFGARKPEANL